MSAAEDEGYFFIDTNILIYAFDQSAPEKQRLAKQIIRRALETGGGSISAQVIQEFLSATHRKFKIPMTLGERHEYLLNVLEPLCHYFPSISSFEQALMIAEETGYSFYDSLILTAALESGCQTLLTEDLQHGRVIRGVVVRNPFLD